MPSGANGPNLKTMSRDGRRLAGSVGRGQSTYPAAVAYDGTVTELESYGAGGGVVAASSDGSVLVGGIGCANPPSCTASGSSNVRWAGSAPPTVLDVTGFLRAASSSGTIVGGDGSESGNAFLFNGAQRILIPELTSLDAITPDGKYVVGRLQNQDKAGVWSAQSASLTNIGADSWTTTTIKAANGTDPAVVGYAYVSASNSYVGFRWKGGAITDLGLLAGGAYTWPYAVSFDGGTAVGLTGTNAFQQAFIWTDKDKLRTIVNELKARGVEPTVDLTLPSADFVSDDGKTIVGELPTSPPTFWRAVLQ